MQIAFAQAGASDRGLGMRSGGLDKVIVACYSAELVFLRLSVLIRMDAERCGGG